MKKDIKQNPYSDALATALRTVSEIGNPDFILLPIEATPEMCAAGAESGNVSEEQAGIIYFAMIEAWAHSHAAAKSKQGGTASATKR